MPRSVGRSGRWNKAWQPSLPRIRHSLECCPGASYLPAMAEEIQLDDAGRPLLTQMSEEGFVDCVFRIARASQTAEAHVLELEASHEGAVVGCRAIVRRDLRAGFD